jgi:hypothetical protein
MDGVQRLLAGVIRTVIVDAASDDPATRAEALDWLSGTDYFTAIGGEGLRATLLKRLATPGGTKRLLAVIGEKPAKRPRQKGQRPVTTPSRQPCSRCGRPSITPACCMCQLG